MLGGGGDGALELVGFLFLWWAAVGADQLAQPSSQRGVTRKAQCCGKPRDRRLADPGEGGQFVAGQVAGLAGVLDEALCNAPLRRGEPLPVEEREDPLTRAALARHGATVCILSGGCQLYEASSPRWWWASASWWSLPPGRGAGSACTRAAVSRGTAWI